MHDSNGNKNDITFNAESLGLWGAIRKPLLSYVL